MIHAGIKPKVFNGIGAFFGATRDADNMTAHQFGNLPDRRPNRPGCGGHADRLARFRRADLCQACPSGETWHPQNAQSP